MPQYAIEIAGPNNDRVLFPPLGAVIRGRWDQAKTAHLDKGEAMRALALVAHTIPGRMIAVDTDKMLGKVVDPLGHESNKGLLEKLNAVFKAHSLVFGGGVKPYEDQTVSLTVDTVKDWLYWMRRLVDNGMAQEVGAGYKSLPPLEDIRKMPGKRRADPLYTGPQTAKSPDSEAGLWPWADEVPVEGKRSGAAASGASN